MTQPALYGICPHGGEWEVSSDMSSISRRRANRSCINSSGNTIPSIIHKARHFLPSWVILISQLGQLKFGVHAQSHIGNTQPSQDSSSVLAWFQHLQFSATSHCWEGTWLSSLAQQAHRAIPHFPTQLLREEVCLEQLSFTSSGLQTSFQSGESYRPWSA